ncbi:uncharacterized protein LOC104450721 [Eucalyptus grandis]|uniref:uncharacterized protein LOC104450721 n=1 Tax=Eucalyptus grandis TaxID=71139 RepID=UPI00192EFBEE|nr:uncharacterized protein LOC104450721 [Eucalyptus grandis]
MIVPVHCSKPCSPASAPAASALVRAPSFSRRIADIRIPTKPRQVATGWLLTAALIIWPTAVAVAEVVPQPSESDTLSNVPQMLSGECKSPKDCKKPRIQRPKSRKAESCTTKCVTTCIRGGDGSPGEGPLNIRRPMVVFKQGFRSRKYCLVECSDICNLIGDEDYGP